MTEAIVTADELRAVVGLPDQIAERDAAALEMLLNAGGEYGTGGRRAGLSKGPEQQAAVDVAGGILDGGQIERLGLRPVTWDIVEILGIGRDLLKDAPGSLDVGEVLFALVFTWALFQQTVLAPDALQSTMAEGEDRTLE